MFSYSLKRINWRLYFALLVMGFVPTIYTTVRVYFLGQLPGDWSYSIAGQLSWVNLLYEIIDEAIILPLFFMLGAADKSKDMFINRVKTGFITSGIIYALLSSIVILFARPLLNLMAADASILEQSALYIRIEAFANIFGILYRFMLVVLLAIGKEKFIYIMTFARLMLCLLFDAFLVSPLSFSLNLGVNGIGYSNFLVNLILTILALYITDKAGFMRTDKPLSFLWIKDFFKIGALSGLESFVRNIAYIVMISRMVNLVSEQGTYWVANNFIWGWLLLPVLQLGELIKQETSKNEKNVSLNLPGYLFMTSVIVVFWILALPFYKPFIHNVMGCTDTDKIMPLVRLLIVPYIAFAYQNIFDSIFYGRGAIEYMLAEALITNIIYYGGMFVAYRIGLWTPSLTGIALMFGIGNIFDSIVSWLAFMHFREKGHIVPSIVA